MSPAPARLWDRLPDEPDRAWKGFMDYRDAGLPGDPGVFAKSQGLSIHTIYKWSSAYRWKQRLDAWDAHLRQAEDNVIINEVEKLAKDQLRAWYRVRHIAEATLVRHAEELVARKGQGAEISYMAAVQALQQATTNERLIVGEATARSEATVTTHRDLTVLTDDELRELERIERKVAGG